MKPMMMKYKVDADSVTCTGAPAGSKSVQVHVTVGAPVKINVDAGQQGREVARDGVDEADDDEVQGGRGPGRASKTWKVAARARASVGGEA